MRFLKRRRSSVYGDPCPFPIDPAPARQRMNPAPALTVQVCFFRPIDDDQLRGWDRRAGIRDEDDVIGPVLMEMLPRRLEKLEELFHRRFPVFPGNHADH